MSVQSPVLDRAGGHAGAGLAHSAADACPVCGSAHGERFFSQRNVPTLIGLLWPDATSARNCPKGDVDLTFCQDCGFVWNTLFDIDNINYTEEYNNSLHHSPLFQNYTHELVERLTKTYALQRKTIIDIGGGKGDFLRLLCEAGDNRGIGFDPSYDGSDDEVDARISWHRELFTAATAQDVQADLIVSRFVFEHVPDPIAFLETLRDAITYPSRTVIYFEVPNLDLITKRGSAWDVIYEHCNYFSKESLASAFIAAGFEVIDIKEPFDEQFLTIEARVAPLYVRPDLHVNHGQYWGNFDELAMSIDTFRHGVDTHVATWRRRLADWREGGVRAVAWGAGAKAVGFFNLAGVDDSLSCVVDVNPAKHGKFLPGTGHEIVPPEALREIAPDVVVLMNPVYTEEIRQTLVDLDLHPTLIPV